MGNFVITINRDFGSLGRPIAKRLAELLGIEYYDRDIVEATAKKLHQPVSVISEAEERKASGFFSMLFPLGRDTAPHQRTLFETQAAFIQEVASKQSCIIVGRCADYVLRDDPNVALVNLFVHAPMAARIRRESTRTNTTPAEAEKRIRQVDKERAAYYNFFSSKRWGDAQAYDLCVNTDGLEISDVVQLVLRYLELRGLR